MAEAKAVEDETQWQRFARRFRQEIEQRDAGKTLDVLAALSHQTDFAIGCYCENEQRCHRSVLRALLAERGANLG